MLKNITDYWQTNLVETTSGNFATPLLHFHMETIGLSRILFSIDYPFVSISEHDSWRWKNINILEIIDFRLAGKALALVLRIDFPERIARMTFVGIMLVTRPFEDLAFSCVIWFRFVEPD